MAAFDVAVLNKESSELPTTDLHRLTVAMKAYRLGVRAGFVVKSYGEGLMRVKDDSHGSGRRLFFQRS